MRINFLIPTGLILIGLLAGGLPAFAGDLDARLTALVGAGADYEGGLTALVDDPSVGAEALAASAASPDWRVRHEAAVVEGWRQDPALYEALSAMAPIKTRIGTVRFTGDFRDKPQAAPALLDRYLHGAEDAATRAALVEALFYTGGDWGQALSELLPLEPSVDVQVMMIAGLRDAEGEWALGALERALGAADPLLRAEAAASAGWRADGAALGDALILSLSDTDEVTRANAARSLGVLGVTRALDSLESLLADPSADARLNALRAISRLDPAAAAALPQLGALSGDVDGRVARLAAGLIAD